jgi:Succinylglutamate desuccinylase / Aspartoacylase family
VTSSVATPIATSFRPRVIGRLRGAAPGPTLVAVGSIHGNEPAGSIALAKIVERLEREQLLVRGDLLALVGNLPALEAGARFIDEDLNRRWSGERIERVSRGELVESAEDAERKKLIDAIFRGFREARGPVVLVDLHSTSGDGKPFAVFADTMRSRGFARRFPVPLVLGLEEQLEGTLVDYIGLLGHVAVGFEGGQHEDPRSVDNLASVVWIALGELQMVVPRRADVNGARTRLARATGGIPGILEVTYRHAISREDAFRMRPGYRSFEPIVQGQVIADDVDGEVAVPSDGFLLMPLYQQQGDDGFFVVRRVRAAWLALSALLRRLKAGKIAHWLPGVSRIEGEPHALQVDLRVARWSSLKLLHLLGFRKRSGDEDRLIVEQRVRDLP